jgi:eukaryotic-like serine/threonine-protein kinase
MPLAVGQRLGEYQVEAPLGAGGMGEVYRGRDTKLERDVALKLLPPAFAADPQRRARFEREAKLLAALNHSAIAQIYGVAEADGQPVLVMELAPGEDLQARIARGRIPVDEALAIAKQIAEALEAAHEKGIVHRDLKPANVKLGADGGVKVLDFGLAKALDGDAGGGLSGSDASHSPTLMRGSSEAGVLLGTAAYMAPEQARGRPVDKRADIWSFGVVLYEMLTGARLFAGETVSDVLAAVLTRVPDWRSLPPQTPAGVRALLRHCLERDPKKRLHDAGDARILLEASENASSLAEEGATTATQPAPAGSRSRWLSPAAFLALGGVVGWGVSTFVGRTKAPDRASTHTVRYEIPIPGHSFQGDLALSPDRRTLVYSAAEDSSGIRNLWIRPLDSLESKIVEGTDDARFPFWSPDSRQLGFFALGEMHALDLVSGSQRTLAQAGQYGEVRGATWSRSGVIVFNPRFSGGLLKVSDKGGAVEPASKIDSSRAEGTHRFPCFLPDGKHFTFYSSPGGGTEPGELCLGELGSLEHRCLGVASSSGLPTPSGHLLFVRGKALLAQRVDADQGRLVGELIPLDQEFPANLGTSGQRAFSTGGDALAFHLGAASRNRLVWLDRKGVERDVVYDRPADWIFYPRLAPDGRRIAVGVYRPNTLGNIWILDPTRNGETPMTREGDSQSGTWSHSGRDLAILNFGSGGDVNVLRADSDKAQSARLWKTVAGLANLDSWTADDRGVLLSVVRTETSSDIFELSDSGELRPVVATRANEHSAEPSPDGRWLAYVSDVGGREDVYVAPMSGQGNPWKVSTAGGSEPRWRHDGRELFYIAPGGRLHSVSVNPGATFSAGPPQALFSARFDTSGNPVYDVANDGQRFLVNLSKSSPGSPIVIILGLEEEIRARAARQSSGQ